MDTTTKIEKDFMNKREEFLLKMYDQMFNDIDRHHKIVWQVIGVLIASFAVIALAEKEIVPIDYAVAIVVMVSLWVITHVYDSNYWYNRNLVIISNIERQFLDHSDLKNIHYYFGKHRDKNSLQTSLKIQLYLSYGVLFIFLLYHFNNRIYDGLYVELNSENIDFVRSLPYLCGLLVYFILVRKIRNKRRTDYEEFINNSPGITVETDGIEYGAGHPTTPEVRQCKQESEEV